eukprot:7943350-Alexandrium_andersonii.AAC.1
MEHDWTPPTHNECGQHSAHGQQERTQAMHHTHAHCINPLGAAWKEIDHGAITISPGGRMTKVEH